MAKRSAATDLNHENWAEEDSSEEQGVFQKASAEELGKRVIKTARRRNTRLGNESTKGAFAGFEGFKVASSTTPSSVSFNFGSSNKSSSSNGTSNESASIKSTQASTSFVLSHNPITTASSTVTSSVTTTTKAAEKTSTESSHSSEYYGQLKSLNESVSAWIKSHVDKNPICILTPIFRDYEKYLAEIEETEQKKTKGDTKKESSAKKEEEDKPETSKSSSDKTFSFTLGQNFSTTNTSSSSTTTITTTPSFFSSASTFQSTAKSDTPGSSMGSGFIFGKKAEDSKDQSIKNEVNPFLSGSSQTFNFGQSPGTTGAFSSTFPSAGFTFGGSSTFASAPKTESTEGNTAEKEEDDDETPKDEFKPIVEEDALYTKRCKLFVKKEGKYNECGIGTLHIKPVPGSDDDDSKRIQVVVRADNAIGTVLLNVVLGGSSKLPAPTRVGKNNVMLVCPLPSEADNVPMPVLVRVKEAKDADELFSQLTELD